MVQLSIPTAAATRTPVRAGGAALTPVSGLILAALAGASCKQGGFYATAQWYLAVMLSLATLAALVSLGPSRPGESRWSIGELGSRIGISNGIGPTLALIGWTMLDAGLHGAVGSGCRLSLLVLAVLAVIADCRTLDAGSVELVLSSLLLLGAVLGLLGWFGVAVHRSAWAIPGQGLWRASATLSYPNAAAVLLAIIALLGLALRCADLPASTSRWYGVLLTAALTGVGATLSRGGLLALAVGTLVLLIALGWRRLLLTGGTPVLGALLALGGLLPSVPTTAEPRPALAGLALVAGLALGALTPNGLRRPNRPGHPAAPRSSAVLIAGGLLGTVLIAATVLIAGRHSIAAIGRARFTVASADRLAAWHAVWHQIALRPVIGSGPGLKQLAWTDPDGALRVFAYAHDEYLQLFAELGLIGLIALAGCLVALGRLLHRWRPVAGSDRTVWAAACAAVLAVACSSLLDFTAHFPAIPLTAAALVGCAAPGLPARQNATGKEETK